MPILAFHRHTTTGRSTLIFADFLRFLMRHFYNENGTSIATLNRSVVVFLRTGQQMGAGIRSSCARLAATTLALTVLSCSAALASTGIVNSKHNMSSTSTSGVKSDNTQICIYCHTPHASFTPSQAAGSSAIWNHSLSSATYVLRSGESQSDFQPNATTNNA